MSWLGTLLIALLTALMSAVLCGFAAAWGGDWYRVSAFEGQSGPFGLFIVFAGLIGGLLIGVVMSRIAAAGADPSFGKGLRHAASACLVVIGIGTGIARWLADVPPTLNGETLMLQVELRWPASQRTSPAADGAGHVVGLGALSGHTLRTSKQGPLWLEDARLQDGRWIAPGAVELFTNRGQRLLRIEPEIPGAPGLLVPMGRPRARHLAWSEWLPHARPGAPALPDGFSYRFKVIPRSAPSRTETIGAFEVDTIAESFHVGARRNGRPIASTIAQFAIRHRGQALSFDVAAEPGAAATSTQRATSVASLAGHPAALLVRVEVPMHAASCRLLVDEGGALRVTPLGRCDKSLSAEPLTDDPAWREAGALRPIHGGIDRESFMRAGRYLFSDAILDSGQRAVRRIQVAEHAGGFDSSVAALGMSPDGRGIVRLGFSPEQPTAPMLLVLDTDGAAPYLVPIDPVATRYAGPYGLDPAWLAHYYDWQRHADGRDGRDRLVARPKVAPLPYRGAVHVENSGGFVYQLQPVRAAMIDVLAAFLQAEFKAQALGGNEATGSRELGIDGVKLTVFADPSHASVVLFLDEDSDLSLVRRIAGRFDTVLATGRHDALFTP